MRGLNDEGLGGLRLMCMAATSRGEEATKGSVPVAKRNMMTPQA